MPERLRGTPQVRLTLLSREFKSHCWYTPFLCVVVVEEVHGTTMPEFGEGDGFKTR